MQNKKYEKQKNILSFLILILVLIIGSLYAIKTGSIELTFEEIYKGLFIEFNPEVATIYDLRFPRIIVALIAGASLAVSGVLLQAVTKNPLTDPGIIGISAAAALTSSLIIIIFPKLYFSIPALSILGGLFAYILIYLLAWDGGISPVKLILVGVALNMTFIGIDQAIKSLSGGNLTRVQSIIEGNVAQKTWIDVRIIFVYGLISIIAALFTSKTCNLLSLEDKTAKSIGVNVDRDRFIVALIGIILASVSTAIVGVIGFLGLIVPHLSRLIVGSNHKLLIPFSALLGSLVFLISDTIGRSIAYPYEIKPAIIMTVIGGPFFIILLKVGGKNYGN